MPWPRCSRPWPRPPRPSRLRWRARRPAPVAYVANVESGTISRIRLATGRAERPVSLGRRSGPWAIAVAPGGRTIWVANIESGTVTPVSTRTGRAGRPVQVPAQPDELVVAPDGKTVWVASRISITARSWAGSRRSARSPGGPEADPGRYQSGPDRGLARQPDRVRGHAGPQRQDPGGQPDRDQRPDRPRPPGAAGDGPDATWPSAPACPESLDVTVARHRPRMAWSAGSSPGLAGSPGRSPPPPSPPPWASPRTAAGCTCWPMRRRPPAAT